MNIYITDNEVGSRCREWAEKIMPENYFLTDIKQANIVFSIYEKKLFPKEFVKEKKIFNFHHGKLPDYRGTGTHTFAIINEEKEFGITLHEVDEGIDTGAIIDQICFPIEDFDTAELLVLKGNEVVVAMFVRWFERLVKGEYDSEPQKFKGTLYQRKDLEKIKDLSRVVRAFQFERKEPCFYDDSVGKRIYLKWYQ